MRIAMLVSAVAVLVAPCAYAEELTVAESADRALVSYSLRRSGSSIRTRVFEIDDQQTNPTISDHRPLAMTLDLP